MALGVFIGLMTPPGPQMVIAAIFATFIRFNRISSIIGVWISNPLTIPFLYPLQVWIGSLISGIPIDYEIPLSIPELWQMINDGRNHMHLVITLIIGAVFLTVVLTPASYYITRSTVIAYRHKKEQRLRRKREKALAKLNAQQNLQ